MPTLLFLGASGFIGKHLVNSFYNKGFDIVVLTRSLQTTRIDFQHLKNIKAYEINLSDINSIRNIIIENNIDIIFHLASGLIPSSNKKDFNNELNSIIAPTFKLIDLASTLDKKIIFFSSGGTVYSDHEGEISESSPKNSINYYGKSKLLIEERILAVAEDSEIDFLIVRPSNVFGKLKVDSKSIKQGFIEAATNKILNNEPIIIWGDGTIKRDYLYITDLVKVIGDLIDIDTNYNSINIASGISHSLLDVIEILEKYLNRKASIVFKAKRNIDIQTIEFNISHLTKLIVFKPLTLNQSIERYVNSLNKLK